MSHNLTAILHAIQHGSNRERTAAEQKLEGIWLSGNAMTNLCEYAMSTDNEVENRYLSAILLRKCIEEVWESSFFAEKSKLLDYLSSAMFVTEKKIRNHLLLDLAHIIPLCSKMTWSVILEQVTKQVENVTYPETEAAFKLLSYILQDSDPDIAVPFISPAIPLLIRFCHEPQLDTTDQSRDLRRRCAKVLRLFIASLSKVSRESKKSRDLNVSDFASEWLTTSTALLRQFLKSNDITSSIEIILELLRSATGLVSDLSDGISGPNLHEFLDACWDLLSVVQVIESNGGLETDESGYDSDGDEFNLTAMTVQTIMLISSCSECSIGSVSSLIEASLISIVEILTPLAKLTSVDVDNWHMNPNQFIADEQNDFNDFSLRKYAGLFIEESLETCTDPQQGLSIVFHVMVGRLTKLASSSSSKGNDPSGLDNNEWRELEAIAWMVGHVSVQMKKLCRKYVKLESNNVCSNYFESAQKFVCKDYFDDVVNLVTQLLSLLSLSNEEAIRGRMPWLLGQFYFLLPQEDCIHAVRQVIEQLCSHDSVEYRISSHAELLSCARCLGLLLPVVPKEIFIQDNITMVNRLIDIAQFCNEDTVHLAIETIVVIAEIMERDLDRNLIKELFVLCQNQWKSYETDVMVVSVVRDLCQVLISVSDGCGEFCESSLFVDIVEYFCSDPWSDGDSCGLLHIFVQVLCMLFSRVQDAVLADHENECNMLADRLCACCAATNKPGLARSCVDCVGLMLVAYSSSSSSSLSSEVFCGQVHDIFDALMNGSFPCCIPVVDSGKSIQLLSIIVTASFACRYLHFCLSKPDANALKLVLDVIISKIAVSSDNPLVTNSFVIAIVQAAARHPSDLFSQLLHTDMNDVLREAGNSPAVKQYRSQSALGFILDRWSEVHDDIDDEFIGKVSLVGLLRLVEFLVSPSSSSSSSSDGREMARNYAISNKILITVIQSAVDLIETEERQAECLIVFDENDGDDGLDENLYGDEDDDDDDFDDGIHDDDNENDGKGPFVARDKFLKEMYGFSDEDVDEVDSQVAGDMLESIQTGNGQVMLFADKKCDVLHAVKTSTVMATFVEYLYGMSTVKSKFPSWVQLPKEELNMLQNFA